MSTKQAEETTDAVKGAVKHEILIKRHPETEHRTVRKVWIDLENSPHIPFFEPIIKELKRRDCEVVLTARDCFQVIELADLAKLEYRKIGRHYGKNRIAKVVGLFIRVLQMTPVILRERPAISVSHGSRTLMLLSAILGIPSIIIADYEFADFRLTSWIGSARKKWIMTPSVIPSGIFEKNGMLRDHVLHYPGIKEDVYVPSFLPQDGVRRELGIAESEILITMRPPASEAHYHNPDSDRLFQATIEHLASMPEVRMVVLPRRPKQGHEIAAAWPNLCASRKLLIPAQVLDGLNLIWHSDLVISGGGTMNREAAALGVPVYSVFRGNIGAVDQYLAANGRLVLLESAADLTTKLSVRRRNRGTHPCAGGQETLEIVTSQITRLAEMTSHSIPV